MNQVQRVVFGIVANDDGQFSVWPTHRRLPLGWRHIGPTGTRAEMHAWIREQFVETVPATYISRESRHQALSTVD
jgi:MbtH protein